MQVILASRRSYKFARPLLWVPLFVLSYVLSSSPFVVAIAAGIVSGPPEARADGWAEAVGGEITESEYHLARTAEGTWSAPNREHGLRLHVSESGLLIVPRLTELPDWTLLISLVSYGRPEAMESLDVVLPVEGEARLEMRRPELTEWYINSKAGLEQGFDIVVPPREGDRSQPLVLEMTFSSSLLSFPSEDGASILFSTPTGRPVLRYGTLHVRDAARRALSAHLEVAKDCLRIVIDDRDATYPIAVDPLMTSPTWTADGNQAGARFGVSVATAGDVNGDGYSDVIIGADAFENGQTDEGRAFVFLGSASGLATTPVWTAEANQANALFGRSVAPAGDVNGDGFDDVLVGALRFTNGETNEGRAFLYLGSSSGPSSTPSWTAEGNSAGAFFGTVASAGDVNGDGYTDVIVGARLYANGQTNEGRAQLYLGGPSGLSVSPSWSVEGDSTGAQLGHSVSTAGDVNGDGYADVLVGEPFVSFNDPSGGRGLVYLGSPGGPALTPSITLQAGQIGAQFGLSVSTAGDVNGDGRSDIVIGAPQFDSGETDEGKAYVYLGTPAGVAPTPAWTVEGNQAGAGLGNSVATAGDINGDGYADLVIGASLYDVQTDEGRALVYLGGATGPATEALWIQDETQARAQFGASVGTAGDVNGDGFSDLIVGASLYDGPQADGGRAFVYLGSADPPQLVAGTTRESNLFNARFGSAVALAGDVNGDGFSDLIVGTLFQDAAYVYLGGPTGLQSSPAWSATGTGGYGYSVAQAGDVNGDGYGDVLVGAPQARSGLLYGKVTLYLGSASGLGTAPTIVLSSAHIGSLFGASVSSAGDVNGDGYGDIIVGAPNQYNVGALGRAFVYLGSAIGLASQAAWSAVGDQYTYFGGSVASAGDVNADGYGDVVVGAPDLGRAQLYLGGPSGPSPTPAWTETRMVGFAHTVASAGDVNGDGYSDLLISAGANRAFLYLGQPSGVSATPAWSAAGDQYVDSVASAGDVNMDGYSDIILGDEPHQKARVYLGSASGPTTDPAWTVTVLQGGFGHSVAGAGDVSGDGAGDVVVGAPLFDNGQTDEGRISVYNGNGGRGPTRAVLQTRVGSSIPVHVLGKSSSETSFGLKVIGRTALGRDRVRLESEVKVPGSPFDGVGLGQTGSQDTGPPNATGSSNVMATTVGGLMPENRYKWRVRIASSSPLFPSTPWLSLPYNGRTEMDLRTDGEGLRCPDVDGDGFGSPGRTSCPGGVGSDCDDARVSVYPGAPEICDGLNNDCNSPSWPSVPPVETDGDGDGYAVCQGDCNDSSTTQSPGNPELCDGLDNNCDGSVDNFAMPERVQGVSVTEVGLSWTSVANASGYDVIRGDVTVLVASGGNFTVATEECLVNDTPSTALTYSVIPVVGRAHWYLVRGVGCVIEGSYDSGDSGQRGLRDAEINASPSACP